MTDEAEQLRAYLKSGSEEIFAGIVRRYLPLVYASALRRVGGDVHRAEDVTQLAFVALARNAHALSRHPDLTGWLFTTTRFIAAKTLRSEYRRRSREQEAAVIDEIIPSSHSLEISQQLHVLLDDAVAELKAVDRRVLLLRFHRGFRLAEIGAQLGATENAVQKRLDRALDQLKEKLSGRGVTSTAAALALALETQTALAVPAGLAAASTSAALVYGVGTAGLFGVSNTIMLSKLQIGLIAAVAVAGSAGLVWQHTEVSQLNQEIARQTVDFKQELQVTSARASAAEADVSALLKAIQNEGPARSGALQTTIKLTDSRDFANAVTSRAEALRREGKFQEAVDEYVQGYRTLRQWRRDSLETQRLTNGIAALGRTFPPALAALRLLRDEALQQFQKNREERGVGFELAILNERLGENRLTVSLHDALPSDSEVRQTFSSIAYDAFVEARRYREALVGKNYGSMVNQLENDLRHLTENKSTATSARDFLLRRNVTSIEVLAGAGRLEEARAFTEKLLAIDSSPSTRALIQRHWDRSGQASPR